MSITINFQHRIQAPVTSVWDVISDLAAYPQWNPFMVECESTLQVGSPIKMRVHVLKAFAMPQKETITEHIPEQLLSYGISLPLKMLYSVRHHKLRSSGNTTIYTSEFELKGWLSPLVKVLLKGQLERGFREMSQAIQDRAESLTDQPVTTINWKQ